MLTGLALLASATGCGLYQNRKNSLLTNSLLTEPTVREPIVYHTTNENLKGSKLGRDTSANSRYELESVVINGNRLYISPNPKSETGELELKLIRHEDHTRVIDSSKGTVKVVADASYIPTKVKITDGPNPLIAKEITLETEGEFGKKARIKVYDVSKVETGIIRETQDSMVYNLDKVYLDGKAYFAPRLEKSKTSFPNSLPFYLLPVEGTVKMINDKGETTLRNENGFYEPLRVSKEVLESRRLATPGFKAVHDPVTSPTTGQSKGIK